LIKELKYLWKLIQPIAIRLLALVLAGFGGSAAATLVVLLILLIDLSKGKLTYVLIVFLSLLLFSDSNAPMFYQSGKNAKDLSLILLSLYLIIKGKLYFQYSYLKYFVFYIIIAFIGLLFANFNMIGLQKLLSYTLVIWVIPVFLFLIFEKGEGLVFVRQIIVTFTFLYVIGIVLSRVNPIYFAQFGRFNGIHRNPNGVGIFSTLFIMNAYILREKFKDIFSNKVFYLLIGVFIFCILLSGSRNAIISIGIFALFSVLRIKLILGFLIILIFASSYQFILMQIESLILSSNLEKELRLDTLSYASGRIYIWQACWMEIQNNYWLGHGFSYEEYSKWDKAYYKILPMLIHNYGNIHNSYLTIWLNTGLLGLIAFLFGIIRYVVKFQFKSKLLAPFIFASFFLAFFESYLVASLNPYTWQLWFAFFIVSIRIKPSSIIYQQPEKTTMTEEISSVDNSY
jgi:O-antigen ligase